MPQQIIRGPQLLVNDEDEIVRRKTTTLQTNLFTSQAFIFRTHTLKLFRIERARQFKPMIAFINEFVIELWMNAYIIIIGIGMYVCLYIYMCVCVCVHMYLYIHTHTHSHTHIYICSYFIYICSYVHYHTHTHTHTHKAEDFANVPSKSI